MCLKHAGITFKISIFTNNDEDDEAKLNTLIFLFFFSKDFKFRENPEDNSSRLH